MEYTEPKLVKAAAGWYLKWSVNGHQFKDKCAIGKFNRIKDLKEREKAFKEVAKIISRDLKSGKVGTPEYKEAEMTLIEAIEYGFEQKKDRNKKTVSGYKGSVKFFTAAINQERLYKLTLKETTRKDIKRILDRASKTNKWSLKNTYKQLTHLQALLSVSVDKYFIETNPAHNIKLERVKGKSHLHDPATTLQHKRIMEVLSRHTEFRNFVEMEYHTGMRPEELVQLRLSMIDLEENMITLPDYICKDDDLRRVPINRHLRQMLLDMEVFIYPKDYYLFGSFRTPGRGNTGHLTDFICGPTKLSRDTATKRWEKLIKNDDTGLGLPVTLYSYKKFGANAKREAGMSLRAIGGLFGHSDEQTTNIYLTNGQRELEKEIYEKSPAFL